AHLIARELRLGKVLRWPVTSRTTLRSGLYEYDAIGRAQATAQAGRDGGHDARKWDGLNAGPGNSLFPHVATGDFVHLGPLGTALLPRARPRVLLVDELDKSDFDLPNDLLNIFEDGEFELPELVRVRNVEPDALVYTADRGVTAPIQGGVVRVREFPIVI